MFTNTAHLPHPPTTTTEKWKPANSSYIYISRHLYFSDVYYVCTPSVQVFINRKTYSLQTIFSSCCTHNKPPYWLLGSCFSDPPWLHDSATYSRQKKNICICDSPRPNQKKYMSAVRRVHEKNEKHTYHIIILCMIFVTCYVRHKI